jgi:hypothetical protein
MSSRKAAAPPTVASRDFTVPSVTFQLLYVLVFIAHRLGFSD